MRRVSRRTGVGAVAGVLGAATLAGCTEAEPGSAPSPTSSGPRTPAETPAATPTATSAPPDRDPPRVDPDEVRVATALAAVEHLAGVIGPRPGASPAYFRAADWVQVRLEGLGWRVDRERFRVPAGFSWNAEVAGGPSLNLVATRDDVRRALDRGEPWLLAGAHLDTVALAPGAEDNASGIGVLLAAAEAMAGRATRLPVALVAFGSEEPRGDPDDHHYGSRAFVAAMTRGERRTLRGMVSLDRVGVGDVLPVGSTTDGDPLQEELLAAARRVGVPTVRDPFQVSSDHLSFVSAGMPGVRLGSTPYAEYHSPADLPGVVRRDQLERTARTLLSWLR